MLDRWKRRAGELKRTIPAIFLALRKKETPWAAKLLAAVTVGYALSPIDLIPDFIPVLGCLDDLILLPALAAWTIRLIPEDILAACREEAADLWLSGRPRAWYCAVPVLLLWLLAVRLVIRAVCG